MLVLEPMVVCGEGGEVFMVSTQRRQRKPKRPTHKEKKILQMVLNNSVVQDSYGHGRAGFPWMCVKVDTWFPWMAYERPMDDALMK